MNSANFHKMNIQKIFIMTCILLFFPIISIFLFFINILVYFHKYFYEYYLVIFYKDKHLYRFKKK